MEINTSFQFLFIEAGQRDTLRASILVSNQYTSERILDTFQPLLQKDNLETAQIQQISVCKVPQAYFNFLSGEKMPMWMSF